MRLLERHSGQSLELWLSCLETKGGWSCDFWIDQRSTEQCARGFPEMDSLNSHKYAWFIGKLGLSHIYYWVMEVLISTP